MAKRSTLGNTIAPWRFLVFVALFVVAAIAGAFWLKSWWLGIIDGFDLSAAVFLILCQRIVRIDDAREMEKIARLNDANRTFLLIVTAIVIVVLFIAVGAETVGKNPKPIEKAVIIVTLIIAWLFSNTVYALHYAHMAYVTPEAGCAGFKFPGTPEPVYWDFIYFSFTCGMAFATSDVEVRDQRIRKVVAFHCLAAFAFNIGVLAFTVNLLASGAG